MMEVAGTKPRGHARKTWWNGIREDMKRFGLFQEDSQSQKNGEGKLRGHMANLGLAGTSPLNRCVCVYCC